MSKEHDTYVCARQSISEFYVTVKTIYMMSESIKYREYIHFSTLTVKVLRTENIEQLI